MDKLRHASYDRRELKPLYKKGKDAAELIDFDWKYLQKYKAMNNIHKACMFLRCKILQTCSLLGTEDYQFGWLE